jgi:hypothetical protein
MSARDNFGNLICHVPGCLVVITAPTGLVELQRLRAHFYRAHLSLISLTDALAIRAEWEARSTDDVDVQGPRA